MPGVEFPGEIRTRRLQDLIGHSLQGTRGSPEGTDGGDEPGQHRRAAIPRPQAPLALLTLTGRQGTALRLGARCHSAAQLPSRVSEGTTAGWAGICCAGMALVMIGRWLEGPWWREA